MSGRPGRPGRLVAFEGLDGAGKSTQLHLLWQWLEAQGCRVARRAWNSSPLVMDATIRGRNQRLLTPTIFSLIHSTDFADRYERETLPMLKGGWIVLCDRYVFTLMARDLVRDAHPEWIESLFSMGVVPDAVFYLRVSMLMLVERTLRSYGRLDYWESGMDLAVSRDWFDCFTHYQRRLGQEFGRLQAGFGFQSVNADGSLQALQTELRSKVAEVLGVGVCG
ncbi:MAG: thymidylate kinase [Deltaproteobacteria bacterium]|nr:thymidylate kinase [Deltaproteobacteria bacterium]